MNRLRYILIGLLSFLMADFYSQCGSTTPSFTVSMVGNPNGTYISPVIQRADTCCGSTAPDKCLKFTIFLDPNAMGINFGIASGAVPPGALFYQINCGPPIAVGTPICLSGAGPHVLTFCKPGNNNNTYSITSIPAPSVPDSITVRSGCTQTLSVSGYSVPTINWTSVAPGAAGAYNSYLSCTSGCATVAVSPTGTPPAYVDYQVSGFGQSPCQANFYKDTVRVYFYNDLLAGINPTLTTICFGSTNAVLTATASGGLGPYTYSWTPSGSTSSVVTVGPGTYTVKVGDKTGCPPTTATAVVNQYTLPISVNAGPDKILCKGSPTVALNGTVTNATGGAWSGGGGTFSPTSNSVSTNYIPTAGELTSGVQLYLTTTGNSGCPAKKDTINISFQNVPLANAGPDFTVCANNSVVNLSGTISGFSSTGTWTTSGSGAFTSTTNLTTTYTPSGGDISAGSVNLILTSTGNGVCPPAKDTAKVIITPSPTVNAGTGGSLCSNSSFALNGTVTGGSTTGNWTTSGNGTFSPSSGALNASYTPGSADIAAGSVTLTLTSTNNGNCIPVQDTIIISIKQLAVVNAGPNQALCSSAGSISLSGSVSGGSGTAIWTSSGTGAFSPANTATNAAYAMTATDINNGFVTFTLSSTNNGPCPVVKDTVKISISKLAIVNAGPNQSLCSTISSISLNGSVTSNSNTGVWSASGPGAFNPSNTVMNPSYNVTSTDLSNGYVIFTLTSTNNGACPPVNDTVKVILGTLATASVASGPTLCSNTNSVVLTATVSGVTNTGTWTASGGGSFSPNNSSLSPTYFLTPADLAAGQVTFTITSTNNGPCPAVSAVTSVSIVTLASVNAGPNQSLCSNAGNIPLSGTITGVSGQGIWTASGSGPFSPSSTNLSNTYSFTPTDITNGSVTFTLTSTNNGPCPAVSDTVKISIKTLATLTVSAPPAICSSTGSVALSGTVSGVTNTGLWSSNGTGGFVPGNTSLNTGYFITPTDISNGFATFTLTSTNNGPCPAVTSTASVGITPIATVSAGPNQSLCSNASNIPLSGTVTGVSGQGIWTASGSGPFSPSSTNLSNTYSFTPTDITNGSVTFTLTSTNNGPCPAVSDTVKVSIKTLATLTVSAPPAICSSTGSVALSGTVSGVTNTGLWSSNGTGGFVPGNTSLNTGYLITPTDISNGFATFTLTSTNNGPCPAVTSTASVGITPIATVSAGPNQSICSTQPTIALNGTVSGASGQGFWSSSGPGSFNPSNSSLSTTYSITPTDIANGSAIFTLTSTNNGPCAAVSDTVKVVIGTLATANVASGPTLCSSTGSVALTGTVSGVTNTGMWVSSGSGAFNPGNTSLNTTYFITPADISAGIVSFSLVSTNNGPCPAVTDVKTVTITTIASVNAGANQNLCSNQNTVALSGTITGVSGQGVWTSSGTGPFNPSSSSLANSYSFTPTDITNGSVNFTLTSVNNGPCPAVSDTVKIAIQQLAMVNITSPAPVCSNSSSVALSGTVSGVTNSGTWSSSGSGAFNPGNSSLNAGYFITPADITSGFVTFTLTSTNNGPCPAVSDTAMVSITTLASVNAGSNQNLCSNQGTIALNGTVSGVSGQGIWTASGTGPFNPGSTSLANSYSFTPADITNGSVTFTLTSTNNGPCPAVSDTVKVSIRTLAAVNAGPNQLICSNTSTIGLSGMVNGVTSTGNWTTGGSGAFVPNTTNLNNSYFITVADVSAGSVTFTLTSTNNGPCPAVSDSVMITINQLATVNAGPNQALCSNTGIISLAGSVGGGSSTGNWNSSGSGIFTPTTSALNASYSITPADINNGSVTFTLSSANNGACPVVSDTVKISIKKVAIVNAGPDINICSSSNLAALSGSVSGGSTTGVWSTTGSGNFSPSNTSLSNNYNVSTPDKNAGSIWLILTSSNNGVCPAASDSVRLTITPKPSIAMKSDTTICANNNPFQVKAVLTGGSGAITWTTTGTGNLTINNSQLITYNMSAADISSGFIKLTLISTNNGACGNLSASINVTINPAPTAAFAASTYTAQIPNDPITFTNQSANATSYLWNFGDGNTTTLTNPVHNYPLVGYYNVDLVAINQYGCRDSVREVITVISDIQFPNAFTPNASGPNGGGYNPNDYSNDVFFPYTAGVTEYHLRIFNRWGELIFESRDINTGWDGYFNGKLCQQDAYVWTANVKFFDGRTYSKTGNVTLLR